MAFDFDTITNLIQSPPGQLLAGAGLGGIVWKVSEKVEGVLSDSTKFEIAVWLVGLEVARKVAPWPETFAKVFDRAFGKKHWSWRCFRSLCALSLLGVVVVMTLVASPKLWLRLENSRVNLYHPAFPAGSVPLFYFLPISAGVGLVLPSFLSLFETRVLLNMMRKSSRVIVWVLCIAADLIVTVATAVVGAVVGRIYATVYFSNTTFLDRLLEPFFIPGFVTSALFNTHALVDAMRVDFTHHTSSYDALLFYPAFFPSILLWMYAGSGFILKATRRFDLAFQWFNRKFDIEKKPLSAIGLVAGVLVAFLYWGFALAHMLN